MILQNTIIQTAKKVLQLEAEAIAKVADFIDEGFKNCVEAILQTKAGS